MELPLFVYGTLRRGEENHHFLSGNFGRWLAGHVRGYKRSIAAHGFPAMVQSPDGAIEGELFFLRPELYAATLAACDLLEDIPPGSLAGAYYRRAQVAVATAEGQWMAWAYVDPASH